MANGTGSKRTAEKAYTERLASTVANLRAMTDLLKNHSDRQAAEPTSWGFVGDLAHVDEELSNLVAFLTSPRVTGDAGGSR
jgi:hypothetical protein